MSEHTNIATDNALTAEETLRQWWQTRFEAPLPDDVRAFVHTLVRNESLRMRIAEHLLDDATLVKVRQGRRLCQTKLESIEQNIDVIRAQQQRIRRFIRLNSELERQQQRLYEVSKQRATVLGEQKELERYEAFEAVNGRFQRIHALTRSAEATRQLRARQSVELEMARRTTAEAEKAMVIEQQKLDDTRDGLYRAATVLAEAERLQMHIADCDESHTNMQQRLQQIDNKMQQLHMALDEANRGIDEQQLTTQQLTTRRQTLDVHRHLIKNGAAAQVMLDELAQTEATLHDLQAQLAQAMAQRNERNEQLGRLFSQSQAIKADIDAKNEEVKGHRNSIAGQDSYTLGRRAMELRSRRQMLQTGLSLWRSIATGYDHIDTKRQLIAQMRLRADHLNRTADTLQNDVRAITRQLDAKTYHWTLSKSQNVIELRADLQEGYPCTVCGATHHPWHSDSISEQNALIASMKADCDTLRAELATKSAQLHDVQMELTATQGKLAVETDNLDLLLERQQKDTDEWRTFSRLDSSFAECSPSTNREARTTMMRQLIEKTTIDAENAEKALDTFNYHLNAINGLSSELETSQREAAELAVRLNEVNTSCQVAAHNVETLNQRVAAVTQTATRRRNDLDKLITLPDWYHSWQQSHEGLRMRIEGMMDEWSTLNAQIGHANTLLATLDAKRDLLTRQIATLQAVRMETEASDAKTTDMASKSRNTLERVLQGHERETLLAAARSRLEQQNTYYANHLKRWTNRLRESVAMEARQANLEELIGQTEQLITADRQELDVWMRSYNATHPPVQFKELERVLADGREWGPLRKTIRDISLEHAITQARVDNLRAEVIALQAEGLRPFASDGSEEQEHLLAELRELEEQRRIVLTQMADYEQQLRCHNMASQKATTDTTAHDHG